MHRHFRDKPYLLRASRLGYLTDQHVVSMLASYLGIYLKLETISQYWGSYSNCIRL
jgi:hypothetical protein